MPAKKPSKPKHRLILVEDEPVQRMVARSALAHAGWDILEASNGDEGAELIKSLGDEPVVVLTDHDMPKMSGVEMLRSVRGRRIAAAVLTVRNDPTTIINAFNCGATDFVTKPVMDWDAIDAVLRKADARLSGDEQSQAERRKLEQQADWNYWKAVFLSSGDQSGVTQVLNSMHVQLNQDANFSQVLAMARKLDRSQSTVAVPRELFDVIVNMLEPVTRLAEGVGIAQSIIGRRRSISSRPVSDLVGWLSQLIEAEVRPLAAIRRHRITTWLDERMLKSSRHLHVDWDLLRTALVELCINAMKYSDPEDEVSINMQESGDGKLNLLITNPARPATRLPSGAMVEGVPRELEEGVFKFFVRYSMVTENTYPERWPMGLGLPLVKEVIRQHDGQITLHNETWHLTGGTGKPRLLVACRIELPTHTGALEVASPAAAEELNVDLF